MTSKPAKTLANAIRRGAARHQERHGRLVYRGTVTSINPLGVDLLGTDLTLDDGDITMSAVVEAHTLAVGDILTLLEVEEGDFVATTVITP